MATTLKTRPTNASVKAHIDAIEDPVRRKDCHALAKLMKELTGKKAVLWGDAIIGFGTWIYAYKSGQALEWPRNGFASRKSDITIYLMMGFDRHSELLAQLGKHKISKSCLYVKRLSDIDEAVLRTLIQNSLEELDEKYPQ